MFDEIAQQYFESPEQFAFAIKQLQRFRAAVRDGLDHRLVHLAGRSKASRRKALIGQPRSQLSLRLH
jgi:hypothetical protein